MNAIMKKENLIICDFLRSIGPWSDCIVIGGGYALMIYKLYLSDPNVGAPPVGTSDLDSLIPRRVPSVSTKNIATYLKESGFSQVFKDYDEPATEAYVKMIGGHEVEVEFLTDTATRGDKSKNIAIAGVVAQPLSYLSLSLLSTMHFKTFSGEKGVVVAPEAWVFHKGLTFPKRTHITKVYKDLYGIWYVATQLGGFSEHAMDSLKELFIQYPKWFKTFQENIYKWLANTSPIDWDRLNAQDPFGKLKKLYFEKTIEGIIGLGHASQPYKVPS